MPNGEEIKHITVGGRTSAIVKSRQKKIKGDNDEDDEEDETSPPTKKAKRGAGTKREPVSPKTGKEKDVKRKMKDETEEETPKKRRISGKKDENASSSVTPTRKSHRGKV